MNLVYYDESVLWVLASMVGTPVKVDLHTLNVARGRFTRMCVEIDLAQPVVGRVGINGEWYHVQYEGLHIICTQCDCYGHLQKYCTPQGETQPTTTMMNVGNADGGIDKEHEVVQTENSQSGENLEKRGSQIP